MDTLQTTKPLTARPQLISVTTLFYGSTVAPSTPHNTHSQPNSAHTRPLRTSQSTFPSLINLPQSLNSTTSLATRTRHHAFFARSLSTHCLSLPAEFHSHARQHKATSSPRQVSHHSANTRFRAFPVLFSF